MTKRLALCIVTVWAGCLGSAQTKGATDMPAPHDLAGIDLAKAFDQAVAPSIDMAQATDLATGGDLGVIEKLTVSFNTTQTATPQYAPKNVVVVWIEGPTTSTFVKTIGRWANVRKNYLLDWVAAAGSNDVDAITSATLPDHTATLTATWDMTARGGGSVADGTYTIRMELADRDSTMATQNNQGTFTFNRNGMASMQNSTTGNGGFSNVVINYTGR